MTFLDGNLHGNRGSYEDASVLPGVEWMPRYSVKGCFDLMILWKKMLRVRVSGSEACQDLVMFTYFVSFFAVRGFTVYNRSLS